MVKVELIANECLTPPGSYTIAETDLFLPMFAPFGGSIVKNLNHSVITVYFLKFSLKKRFGDFNHKTGFKFAIDL